MKKIENPKVVECPTLSPERQLLWDAAERMARVGKACDGEEGPNGEFCAIRTIMRVAAGERDYTAADALLMRHLDLKNWWDIAPWSDRNDQATVVSAMRSAALS